MGICFWYRLAFFLCNELDFHGWVLSKNDCRTQHPGCSLFPHLTIAFRTMVGLLDSISIWRHISWMSQTRAAGLWWKQRKTSNNSCCSFGPAWLFGKQGSVLSKALQHCTSHHCNEQICLLCPTPMILSSSVHTILSLTNVPSLLISTKHLSVWSSSHQLQLHQSALYPWLTTFGWCLLLFQTVFYHQVRSNTNPSLQSQMSNGFSIINPNQQVHQSITLDKVSHLTLLALQFFNLIASRHCGDTSSLHSPLSTAHYHFQLWFSMAKFERSPQSCSTHGPVNW